MKKSTAKKTNTPPSEPPRVDIGNARFLADHMRKRLWSSKWVDRMAKTIERPCDECEEHRAKEET